jgi:hypothetical protein
MAQNIVDEIIGMVTPDAVEKIASFVGIDAQAAKKAFNAALPTLLAMFASKSFTMDGAKALVKAVSDADPAVVDLLSKSLKGAAGKKFIENGTSVLTSLLGEKALASATEAFTKQAGLQGTSGSSLMAIASQLALGGIAKSFAGGKVDASGLMNLMTAQQANIKSALPADLGKMLSSSGVLSENFAAQAEKAVAAATSQATKAATGGINWPLWLVVAAAALAALWYFFGQGSQAPKTTATPPAATAPAAAGLVIDGVDIGKQMTTALDGLKSTMASITDTATAQTALPKLAEAGTAIETVNGMLAKLSPEQKTALAAIVTAAMPAIKEAAGKVLAIQGVGDIAKPVVEGLIAKLESLAKPA